MAAGSLNSYGMELHEPVGPRKAVRQWETVQISSFKPQIARGHVKHHLKKVRSQGQCSPCVRGKVPALNDNSAFIRFMQS